MWWVQFYTTIYYDFHNMRSLKHLFEDLWGCSLFMRIVAEAKVHKRMKSRPSAAPDLMHGVCSVVLRSKVLLMWEHIVSFLQELDLQPILKVVMFFSGMYNLIYGTLSLSYKYQRVECSFAVYLFYVPERKCMSAKQPVTVLLA